jgi:hypothetical protein
MEWLGAQNAAIAVDANAITVAQHFPRLVIDHSISIRY